MFWIWSGFKRERDPPEPVEVLDADAVELGVAAQQGEQPELARRVLHLRSELAHRVEDQDPLVVGADDVAGREVVAVAGERQGLRAAHVLGRSRAEVRARVCSRASDRRDVDVTPPMPSTRPVKPAKSTSTT